MRWIRCHHAAAFVAKVVDFLESNEAENNLMLGLALAMTADPDYTSLPPFLSYAEHRSATVAAVLLAPPRELIVTDMGQRALRELIPHLREEKVHPPGVVGPAEAARKFAELWTEAVGTPHVVKMRHRIYRLTALREHPAAPGCLRQAEPSELQYLIEWFLDFDRVTGRRLDRATAEQVLRNHVRRGGLFVWEDGKPVSMAAFAGPTPHGVRVNLVYTPPELRGRGYASGCVATLSRRLLDSGRKFCFLYTDLDNPTSNRIYQRIGYEPVCDSLEILFGA